MSNGPHSRMHIGAEALLAMAETTLDLDDADHLNELLPELEAKLQPFLMAANKADWDIVIQIGNYLLGIGYPQGAESRIRMLDSIAFSHIPFGKASQGIPFAANALAQAEKIGSLPLQRKLCNCLASLHNDAGAPALGAEHAIRGASIAESLEDKVGQAACLGNLTSSLKALGLYKETVKLCLRVIELSRGESKLRGVLAQAYGNMAMAAYSMRQYALGAQTADHSARELGAPSSADQVQNLVGILGASVKNWAALKNAPVARERLELMTRLAQAMPLPRLQMHVALAEAICEIAEGSVQVGATRLMNILPRSKAVPGIYIDALQALISAYSAAGDDAATGKYSAELAEHIILGQRSTLASQLRTVGEEITTRQPGKQDIYHFVRSVATQAPSNNAAPPRRDLDLVDPAAVQATLERLAVSAELGEDITGRHAYRVGRLSRLLAEELQLGQRFCEAIEDAARLHDIGKLAIKDGVLNKPGDLTTAEWGVITFHPVSGDRILSTYFDQTHIARQVALCHHERWDGSGYPRRLAGNAIPIAARIAAVVDVYDALTHARVYKPAWTITQTMLEMRTLVGTQFDPDIGRAFIKMIRRLHARLPTTDLLDAYLVPSVPSAFVRTHDDIQALVQGLSAPWEIQSAPAASK